MKIKDADRAGLIILATYQRKAKASPFPFPPLSFLSLLLLVEVGPLNSARESGGALYPPAGQGRSASGNRFWCILAFKSDIWWQHF